jgi:hypothetical protein
MARPSYLPRLDYWHTLQIKQDYKKKKHYQKRQRDVVMAVIRLGHDAV